MRLEPASRYSYAELADIFTAGYEDYFTPFVLDESAFRAMSTRYDDDLDASRVVVVDSEPAGICKLAIRGERGWIAGIGIAKAYRGKGLGEGLMRGVLDIARERALREVWLEVLFPNEPAIRLYEKLGFEKVRVLEVWSLTGFERGGGASDMPVADAQERIARERREPEPWQREDGSVANIEDVAALASEDGAIVYSRSPNALSLLQGVAADDAAARDLLRSLPDEPPLLSWLNGPEGDPYNGAIDALGGTLAWRQHEMLLRL